MTDAADPTEPAAPHDAPWLKVRLPRVALGDTQRVLLLSIVIGLFAGLLIVCFHIAIDFVRWATVGLPFGWHPVRRLLWPAIGAVIAATLVRFVFVRARGSGVIHAKAAIHISDGIVPPSTVPGKFAACAVSIGCGNSLGPEDPALQMGVGVASIVGRVFRLPREHMRLIAPIGAAAGIAAAFNTPITGVLFVIEEVIGSWNAGVLGSILLSAVSAVVVSRWYLGDAPLFRVPALGPMSPADFLIYGAIGVIGGLASAFYVRLMLRLKKRCDAWTGDTARILLPGLAGLFVGIVGLWLPQVQGPGYLTIDSALHDRFDWSSLLLLGFAKILVTSLCFAAGTPGGLFAPTLFAGAMIGGGIGALAGHYWPFPFPHATQSAFVLVGMGTFFAGVFRAPMTSIFMVFEVSASYQIILPVMIANTLGYLVARQSGRVHFFDELAREEGVELPSVQEARETRGLRVEDAMSAPGTVLRPDATIGDARSAFAATDSSPGPNLSPGSSSGSGATTTCLIMRRAPRTFATVHRAELDALPDTDSRIPLADAYPLPNAPHLYPDLALDIALRKFSSHPALPVVRRDAPDEVIGLLTLEDVAKAFRIERRAKSTPDVLSAAR